HRGGHGQAQHQAQRRQAQRRGARHRARAMHLGHGDPPFFPPRSPAKRGRRAAATIPSGGDIHPAMLHCNAMNTFAARFPRGAARLPSIHAGARGSRATAASIRSRGRGDMLNLERNLLSAALASVLYLAAGTAHAQSAPQAEAEAADEPAPDAVTLDRVEVTGIRRGIEDAIDTKRTSTSIVESISAEDIGKLPDMSIADSLARLPGLTAQR